MKNIFVGLSGGIDSTCAAYLLKEKGHNVSGAYLLLWDKKGQAEEIEEANSRANSLKIPFYVFDARAEFKHLVVDYFKKEYVNGRTPNPCAVCNQNIKFNFFLNKAISLGAEQIAMGHYVKKIEEEKFSYISEGLDNKKDQSYFLSLLTVSQIEKSLFPLANYTKDKVREIVASAKLVSPKKSESQEICFIQNKHYAEFLEDEYKLKGRKGIIRDIKGNVLGEHKGYFYYTVGQRRGLGISNPEPFYVKSVNKDKNEVIVARHNELFKKDFFVNVINQVGEGDISHLNSLSIRTRYNQRKQGIKILKVENKYKVILDDYEIIAPGQLATFYCEKKVVAGGWIIE